LFIYGAEQINSQQFFITNMPLKTIIAEAKNIFCGIMLI